MSSNPASEETAAAKPASKKSPKSVSKAKRKSAADNPKVSEMVSEAIANLKESNGSSLSAIKKYITANFPVEVEKLAPFIRRYLKTQVANGTLIQTKGKGASGSFKLRGVSSTPTTPRKRPSAAVRASAAAAPKPVKAKADKTPKSPKKVSKEKTKRSPKKAKTPKPKKAGRKAKKLLTPKQGPTA